ncbi:MAG TPA: hypothetical protein VMC41_01070 [Candidatus Nanoarchaeia archaeon]|nr:hypothetical protein [Candidatus Nanoarchaeia archaeon]
MSDFYQILKREIEREDFSPRPTDQNNVFNTDNHPVENSNKLSLSKNGKIAKNSKQKNKNNIFRRKKSDSVPAKKNSRRKKSKPTFLTLEPVNPIWLTMAETAKLGGIQKRTVKRAVRSGKLKYRIMENRYQVDLCSALLYFRSKRKLWNKLTEFGIGQYVEKWRN